MAKRKQGEPFNFVVEGSGEFPFDMLRYDCCYPMTERYDSPQLAGRDRRRVTLETMHVAAPTPARWASFGWTVTGYDREAVQS